MDHVVTQISFVFDILITGLLGATIFFAVKLSRHLDTFRSNRADMENLIRELSNQITRAQEGISVLDDLATSRGDELRSIISKARGLSEELQLMTESGNSLATRLENMAVRNRELVEEMDARALGMVYPGGKAQSSSSSQASSSQASSREEATALRATPRPARYEETLNRAKVESPADSIFSIRDPDFEDEESGVDDDGFSSQAERDLAEALARRVPKGK